MTIFDQHFILYTPAQMKLTLSYLLFASIAVIVFMSVRRESTVLKRLVSPATRSTRAAVSSDWSVGYEDHAMLCQSCTLFCPTSPWQYLNLTFVTWLSWWDNTSILLRLALMLSLMICLVHSLATLLDILTTVPTSVLIASVRMDNSFREDNLLSK